MNTVENTIATASRGTLRQTAGEATSGQESIRVWDVLVRVFHWSLVAGIAGAWLTSEDGGRLHEFIGYAVAGLVGLRLVWGIIGTHYARFSQFVRGPRATLAYLKQLLKGHAPRHIGHNPAGAAMIVALLLVISGTAITGWMMTLDAFFGAEWLEEVHEALATLILLLVGLHVAGVVHASITHRENLVRAMFTGRKRVPGPQDVA